MGGRGPIKTNTHTRTSAGVFEREKKKVEGVGGGPKTPSLTPTHPGCTFPVAPHPAGTPHLCDPPLSLPPTPPDAKNKTGPRLVSSRRLMSLFSSLFAASTSLHRHRNSSLPFLSPLIIPVTPPTPTPGSPRRHGSCTVHKHAASRAVWISTL